MLRIEPAIGSMFRKREIDWQAERDLVALQDSDVYSGEAMGGWTLYEVGEDGEGKEVGHYLSLYELLEAVEEGDNEATD